MKTVITTAKAPQTKFPQGIKSGNIIVVSGQVGITAENNQLIADDVACQTRQALANIKAIINEGGGRIEDICKVTIFVTDISCLEQLNEEYYKFFEKSQPVRTTVEVSSLVGQTKIEIEAMAILG